MRHQISSCDVYVTVPNEIAPAAKTQNERRPLLVLGALVVLASAVIAVVCAISFLAPHSMVHPVSKFVFGVTALSAPRTSSFPQTPSTTTRTNTRTYTLPQNSFSLSPITPTSQHSVNPSAWIFSATKAVMKTVAQNSFNFAFDEETSNQNTQQSLFLGMNLNSDINGGEEDLKRQLLSFSVSQNQQQQQQQISIGESMFVRGKTLSSKTVVVVDAQGMEFELPTKFQCGEYTFFASEQGTKMCISCFDISTIKQPSAQELNLFGGDVAAKFAKGISPSQQNTPSTSFDEHSGRSTREMLAREVEIIRQLHKSHVPNIIPLMAACDLESGLRILAMPKVGGGIIQPTPFAEDSSYLLSLHPTETNFDDSFVDDFVIWKEQVLISQTFETVIAMLAAGVLDPSQYHNLIIDDSSGQVTFVDFRDARFVNQLPPKQAAWMVPAFLRSFFVMVPDRHTYFIRQLLEQLLLKYPVPIDTATTNLILDLWDNRFSSANVLPQWRQHYGVQKVYF